MNHLIYMCIGTGMLIWGSSHLGNFGLLALGESIDF